ncbi:Transposase protein [Popillia japonica]|uniref:Transposase protein n=1 Tax=Popillia japonica TaxID=7064 RepID=A0AAW1K2R5_POPJA
MTEEGKLCSMIFEEMALLPHVDYNAGIRRKLDLADHVLVFPVRGIFNKWRQLVCVCRLFKKIVKKVKITGLEIITSICDQGVSNPFEWRRQKPMRPDIT